jgi:tRNA dimethylallyltransferase
LEEKNKLIVVVGPTAVGKTALAIRLAQHFHTAIISADSRQIFRELNLGTAKPSTDELNAAPHYFINNKSIVEPYDAAQFGREALALMEQLFKQQQTLILCGGSGLYVKAVCEGFDDIPNVPEKIREDLVAEFEKNGLGWLQEKMRQLDPDHLSSIDQQNPHRLMRALEVKIGTGKSIADFQTKAVVKRPFIIIKIGLETAREKLYERIDKRMDTMIEAGLFEEVETVYAFKEHNALQTVGYKEIIDFMDGKYDRQEAIRLLKRNSRRYAKRQLTWFKRDETIKWFDPHAFDAIVKWVEDYKA